MYNEYLEIREDAISYRDNVFDGIADNDDEIFNKRAYEFRHSTLANYDHLTKEQREEIAKRWEKAKSLSNGKYDYYFNLEDKNKVFEKSVKELANTLGIKYELTIK